MRYFLHIVTDIERLIDHDGGEFADIGSAHAEADQCARELLAQELLAGRRLPLNWRIHICDDAGTIIDMVSFERLLLDSRMTSPPAATVAADHELIARAKAVMARARKSHHDIQNTVQSIRAHLQTYAHTIRDEPEKLPS